MRILPTLLGVVVAVAVVLALVLAVVVGGVGGLYVHDHGTLEVVVDDEAIDFDQQRYHDRHPTFHVHEGQGNVWHHHPESLLHVPQFERLTVSEALATLDVEVSDSRVTIDGVSYDGAAGAVVTVQVDGQPVDPETHYLQDGDDVVVVVERTT